MSLALTPQRQAQVRRAAPVMAQLAGVPMEPADWRLIAAVAALPGDRLEQLASLLARVRAAGRREMDDGREPGTPTPPGPDDVAIGLARRAYAIRADAVEPGDWLESPASWQQVTRVDRLDAGTTVEIHTDVTGESGSWRYPAGAEVLIRPGGAR